MKRIILTFFAVLVAAGFIFSQQVPREKVVVEEATGTWWSFCPSAALGVAALVANGDPVAPIANHNGDPYANTYSNARNNYYGITGFPTVKFDGILQVVGASGNMYPSYKAKVDQRMAVL